MRSMRLSVEGPIHLYARGDVGQRVPEATPRNCLPRVGGEAGKCLFFVIASEAKQSKARPWIAARSRSKSGTARNDEKEPYRPRNPSRTCTLTETALPSSTSSLRIWCSSRAGSGAARFPIRPASTWRCHASNASRSVSVGLAARSGCCGEGLDIGCLSGSWMGPGRLVGERGVGQELTFPFQRPTPNIAFYGIIGSNKVW